MPATLNDTPISSARITVPRLGVWEGNVVLAGTLDLAEGAAVTIVLGDLTLKGYVIAGGTFLGAAESRYHVAAGVAGWSKTVPAWSLYARGAGQGGVPRAEALRTLAADAGEHFDLLTISPRDMLGDHWQRPAGVASVALSQLLPDGWRVDPDGMARPGPHPPTPVPRSVAFVVEDADVSRRWARIGVADDRLSAFLPGAIVTAGNLASPIVVGEATFHADPGSITVDIIGEGGIVEMLATLVRAIMPPPPLTGLYTYEVSETDPPATPNTTPTAQYLRSRLPGIPPVLACTKVFGLPGASSQLSQGQQVIVAFVAGDPSKPIAIGYLGSDGILPLPMATTIDAEGTVSIGANGQPAALAAPLQDWALGVIAAFASLTPPVSVPALSASVATTKALLS